MPGSLVVFSAVLSICLLSKWVPQGEAKLSRRRLDPEVEAVLSNLQARVWGAHVPQSDVAKLQHPQFSFAWFPLAAPAGGPAPCGTSHSWFLQKDVSLLPARGDEKRI